MIKPCWKCKGPVDTHIIDVTETIGLCSKCYERFDEPKKEREEAPTVLGEGVYGIDPNFQPGPGLGIYSTAPLQPMTGKDAAGAVEKAMGMLPDDLAPEAREDIRKKLYVALNVPAEYIQLPPKPNVPPMSEALMLLQDLISREVKRVESTINDQPEVDRIKMELRAASIRILKEVAPVGVLLSHIERVVDSALGEAFHDLEPAVTMTDAGSPG